MKKDPRGPEGQEQGQIERGQELKGEDLNRARA